MLTADQFRHQLMDKHIPAGYVATLDNGWFEVYLTAGIEPNRLQVMLEDIAAMPEVRAVQRPPTPRSTEVLQVIPSWLPEETNHSP